MAPKPPLLFVDNVFDRITTYRAATLTASSEVTWRDVSRVADYRRERSWWQPEDHGTNPDGNWVAVDLGAGNTRAPDYLWLDRGHNLWGQTVVVESSTDGVTYTAVRTMTAPAEGTVGGAADIATFTATEEGALYTLFTAGTARRYWRVRVPYVLDFVPVLVGVMLGVRDQLSGFSASYDEDAGERTERSEVSDAGYQATDTTYAWRTVDLALQSIGAAEYDAQMRWLRTMLFERNAPAVVTMDWGTYPERSWLYRYDGRSWRMGKTRVTRAGTIRLRETGHAIG